MAGALAGSERGGPPARRGGVSPFGGALPAGGLPRPERRVLSSASILTVGRRPCSGNASCQVVSVISCFLGIICVQPGGIVGETLIRTIPVSHFLTHRGR